jgi:hypothetical protein
MVPDGPQEHAAKLFVQEECQRHPGHLPRDFAGLLRLAGRQLRPELVEVDTL